MGHKKEAPSRRAHSSWRVVEPSREVHYLSPSGKAVVLPYTWTKESSSGVPILQRPLPLPPSSRRSGIGYLCLLQRHSEEPFVGREAPGRSSSRGKPAARRPVFAISPPLCLDVIHQDHWVERRHDLRVGDTPSSEGGTVQDVSTRLPFFKRRMLSWLYPQKITRLD